MKKDKQSRERQSCKGDSGRVRKIGWKLREYDKIKTKEENFCPKTNKRQRSCELAMTAKVKRLCGSAANVALPSHR